MPRKKLKDTKVGKFLIGKGGIISALGDAVPDKGILGLVRNLIDSDKGISPEDKETALELLKMDRMEMEGVTQRWQADTSSDNKLAKMVRPLILLYLTFMFTIYIILDSLEVFSIDQAWVKLLENILITIYVSYFGSRGFEKYAQIKNK